MTNILAARIARAAREIARLEFRISQLDEQTDVSAEMRMRKLKRDLAFVELEKLRNILRIYLIDYEAKSLGRRDAA